jgi:preprotein translocase subunit SecD
LINGEFTAEQAKTLVDGLNEGAMPVALMLAQEEKVSPLVGESALR